MEHNDTIKLSKLFQQKAENRVLDHSSATLIIETGRMTDISISSLTPKDTADYLETFFSTPDKLFRRLELNNGTPSPITLRMNGEYHHSELDKRYGLEPAFMIQFMDKNQPSRITINYDTPYSPDEDRQSVIAGPDAKTFIGILRKAGKNWKKVSFNTPNSRSNKTKAPHLTVVK